MAEKTISFLMSWIFPSLSFKKGKIYRNAAKAQYLCQQPISKVPRKNLMISKGMMLSHTGQNQNHIKFLMTLKNSNGMWN